MVISSTRFFTLLIGLHRYVSGDDKWNKSFQMIRDGDNSFARSHSKIAQFLAGRGTIVKWAVIARILRFGPRDFGSRPRSEAL